MVCGPLRQQKPLTAFFSVCGSFAKKRRSSHLLLLAPVLLAKSPYLVLRGMALAYGGLN